MAKNYYLILGIAPDATQDDIKSAYRRQAMEFHPDHYGPNSGPFREVQEAYGVLSDPERRRAYDLKRVGERRRPRPGGMQAESMRPSSRAEPLIPEEPPADLGDVWLTGSFQTVRPSFDELFDRLWSNFTRGTRPKAERLEPVTVEIVLKVDEARRGGRVRVQVPAQVRCPTCGGRGGVGFFACWRCGGKGILTGEVPLSVEFPPGLVEDHVVQVPLDRLGIHNIYLTVRFRVSREGE